MIGEVKYRGVCFKITHPLRIDAYFATAKLQNVPFPLLISSSTLPELRQGITVLVDCYRDIGWKHVAKSISWIKKNLSKRMATTDLASSTPIPVSEMIKVHPKHPNHVSQ
jgi:hypothetical protein